MAAGQPWLFTGRRFDFETGLYYYRARYYSASLGRFLQTDPVGYEDQMNLYAYVGNDPVNGADPSGMCSTGTRLGNQVSQPCGVSYGAGHGGNTHPRHNEDNVPTSTSAAGAGQLGHTNDLNGSVDNASHFVPDREQTKVDQVARDTARSYLPISKREDREYQGANYRNRKGRIVSTPGLPGEKCNDRECVTRNWHLVKLLVPTGAIILASWHTHPRLYSGPKGIHSVADIRGANFLDIDMYIVDYHARVFAYEHDSIPTDKLMEMTEKEYHEAILGSRRYIH